MNIYNEVDVIFNKYPNLKYFERLILQLKLAYKYKKIDDNDKIDEKDWADFYCITVK